MERGFAPSQAPKVTHYEKPFKKHGMCETVPNVPKRNVPFNPYTIGHHDPLRARDPIWISKTHYCEVIYPRTNGTIGTTPDTGYPPYGILRVP
jgi:hypothetical protein